VGVEDAKVLSTGMLRETDGWTKGEGLYGKAGTIHIGTSGWHYPHWIGPFYPKDLRKSDFLSYYADHFRTVEINNSFYRLPTRETLTEWRLTVQPGFIFAVKGSRYITHMKKLKDPRGPVDEFLERISTLEDSLGPILFQLPPRWRFNGERLKGFLEALPRGYRYAFEFRDPTWFREEVYEAMHRHGAAFCMYELAGRRSPRRITADFVYVRLHGPEGAYRGQYATEVLAGWAEAFSAWAGQGKDIFCYFDNDEAGYAVQDAARLQHMLLKK
jgi:uncharacterized protein YecE (DUF72 family)